MSEWRCFHCDEVFTTTESAIEHFGRTERQSPACQIDIARYRDMEQQVLACAQEDSEVHREMHGLLSDHQLALVREEERGYARGLQDAKDHPEDLGLQAIPADTPAQMETLRTALEILYDMGREDADLPDPAYEDGRRAGALNTALVTLVRLGMNLSQTHSTENVMALHGDEIARLASQASSTMSRAEIERRTTIAFESTNPSDHLSLYKYWFAKGLREGAENLQASAYGKPPAERSHVNSLLAFVTMGFHGRVDATIADAHRLWDSVTRPDGPLAWAPEVLHAKDTAEPNQDTARLDYLEANHATLCICVHTEHRPRTTLEGGRDAVAVFDGWCVNSWGREMPTVREAIDAARFPQSEENGTAKDPQEGDEGKAT